ncbi:ABC transporter substrate-binding protein [Streptomyces sp. NPDC021080]|uniref:ABC transporter substrate-binding protein n=1 Tax=Streptomyces sp. NPDC021080 TaxID=3365110 RepID=UPI003791034E
MAIGIFESSSLSLPDAEAALKASAADINASGGVNGRKIDLIVCNDKYDPNTAADCARQAVSKRVSAVISSYEPFSPQVVPVLEQAKIPYYFSSLAQDIDGTSSVSFPRDGGVPAAYGALGVELAKAGCKKVGAVVLTMPSTQLGGKWLEKGLKSQGASMVQVSVGATQPEYSSPVAKLVAQGADCIVPATAPDAGAKVVIAAQQSGAHLRLGAITSEFGSEALTTLGAAADGMIITGQEYRPTDTQVPAVQTVVDGMKRHQPKVPLTTKFGIAGWASVQALKQLLATTGGSYDAASLLKAAPTAKPDTGLYAPFSNDGASVDPTLSRAKNWNYLVWTVQGGKAELADQNFRALQNLS